MKPCKDCYEVKSLEDFPKNPTYLDGRANQCKVCKNLYEKNRKRTWYHDKHREICKRGKAKRREEFLRAYGGKCACCGESTPEFLELDHINGGGRQHRLREKRDLYQVLKEQGFPKDEYRLLCANCNHSLGVRGYCPHENQRRNRAA